MEVLFIGYLILIFLCLIVGRRALIIILTEDTMRSRGILNLVPISFFLENKEAAEEVIKMMKED